MIPDERTRPRILVVDDAADVRELLAIALRLGGADVVTTASGAEALATLGGDARVDVIVVDVQMPDFDGWDLLGAVRALGPPTPATVVCSVKTSDADRARAARLGAAAYVTKPFDVGSTVELILGIAARPA